MDQEITVLLNNQLVIYLYQLKLLLGPISVLSLVSDLGGQLCYNSVLEDVLEHQARRLH